MSVKPFAFFTGIVATAISTVALADAPRYDFADVLYQSINDPSGSGISSDHAYGIDGSYAFTDQFIGAASYSHENADFSIPGVNGTISGDGYSAGVGYRIPLTESVDFVPNLSYVSSSASASASGFSNSTTNTGYDAGVQLRAMLTPTLEFNGSIDHSSPGSSTNQVSIAALYSFTPAVAVGVGYASAKSNGQTTTGWTVALRYYFK